VRVPVYLEVVTLAMVDRGAQLERLFAGGWTTDVFAEFWKAPDLSYIPSIITDDVVGYWPGGRTVRGREEYMRALEDLLALLPDLHLEVQEHTMSADGEFGFTRWVMHATGANGPFELDGMDRTRVRDGLVCENYVFFDSARFQALVGSENATTSKESGAVTDLYLSWTAARIKGEPQDNERWGDLTAEPRDVDYIETEAGGLPAMWAIPKACAEDRVLLCIHGGGFVGGSIYTHRKLFGHIAKAVGARALSFDYRLAPSHTHPAPVDDATAAYRWLLEQRIEPAHVAFTGDSSGGGLTITAQLRAREQGLPLPAAAMPLSPWTDMEVVGESYRSNWSTEAFFYRELVQGLASMYLGDGGDARDPLANPLYADLSGLPPMYIQVAGDETLLDDSRRLADRARAAGVEVRLDVFPGQQHTFQRAAGRAPEADEAIRKLAGWVRPLLGLAGDA
jgi:epsilon-lactone hydrolase